jgi:hypothetical protein
MRGRTSYGVPTGFLDLPPETTVSANTPEEWGEWLAGRFAPLSEHPDAYELLKGMGTAMVRDSLRVEREHCARLAEQLDVPQKIAAAIRERNQ